VKKLIAGNFLMGFLTRIIPKKSLKERRYLLDAVGNDFDGTFSLL
jgi:hypothetical protein